jgi:lysophospholipase L1-like esterase
MGARSGLIAVLAAALVLAVAGAAWAAPAITGYPNSIAAAGDSITRGYDADAVFPPGERLQYSWATGTSSKVNSLYLRILAANPAISGNGFNDAATGAKMSNLAGQVSTAVSQNAAEVVIELGGNDACTSTVGGMTPVTTYRSEFASAMKTLSLGLPDARIYVLSVPNVYRLWLILHGNGGARAVWSAASICQSLLANPTSTAQADVQRRAAVRARVVAFNKQLQQVCATFVHCRFDGNAVFNNNFLVSDVNTLDYFHPSISGQAKLAGVAWSAGFNFTDTTPPVSTATVTPVTGGATVTLSSASTDLSGIEYRIGSGHYIRYAGPVIVGTGKTITWRAVDVNGNIEATQSRKIS